MPTYEYACEKCGQQFEFFQSITEDPLKICPKEKCARKKWSKGRVKRVIGAGAGLIFKGSGFYITDYRSDSYKEAAKKEKDSSKGSSTDKKPSGDSKSSTSRSETKSTKPSPSKD